MCDALNCTTTWDVCYLNDCLYSCSVHMYSGIFRRFSRIDYKQLSVFQNYDIIRKINKPWQIVKVHTYNTRNHTSILMENNWTTSLRTRVSFIRWICHICEETIIQRHNTIWIMGVPWVKWQGCMYTWLLTLITFRNDTITHLLWLFRDGRRKNVNSESRRTIIGVVMTIDDSV